MKNNNNNSHHSERTVTRQKKGPQSHRKQSIKNTKDYSSESQINKEEHNDGNSDKNLQQQTITYQRFQDGIQACEACADACNHCATQCLNEGDVKMFSRCIQLNFECAAICRSAVELMSLGSDFSAGLCHICVEVCIACALECDKHAKTGIEHCKDCANACRECAEVCEQITTQ